jgi:hypothetical protein
MRIMKTTLFVMVIVVSAETLHRYFDSLRFQWQASEGSFSWRWFDEHSLWLYRERGSDGLPAGAYRLTRYFSPIDPDDGPNWEIRIPGRMPAGISIIALSCATYALIKKPRCASGLAKK